MFSSNATIENVQNRFPQVEDSVDLDLCFPEESWEKKKIATRSGDIVKGKCKLHKNLSIKSNINKTSLKAPVSLSPTMRASLTGHMWIGVKLSQKITYSIITNILGSDVKRWDKL